MEAAPQRLEEVAPRRLEEVAPPRLEEAAPPRLEEAAPPRREETISSPARKPSWLVLVHVVGIIGLAAFVVPVATLHVLRPDLDPARHSISEYSLGSDGWLMRGAFIALGLGTLATALGLRVRFGPSARRRASLLLLVGAAIGLLLDAGFNTDHLRVPETLVGRVHGSAMLLICLTLPTAACLLGADFAKSPSATSRARALQVLGLLQLVAILDFQVGSSAYRGVAERVAVTFGVAILAILQSFALSPAGERAVSGRGQPRRTPRPTLLPGEHVPSGAVPGALAENRGPSRLV